jgi:transcription elongation factor Elf1
MPELNGKQMFPCPVCTDPREVRLTKKKKPYITCDPCGIQVFVRGPAGIAAFNRLIDRANGRDLWTRLREMESRYNLKCPKCGCRFWAERELVKTNWVDGSFLGFRCPECEEIVEWEKAR